MPHPDLRNEFLFLFFKAHLFASYTSGLGGFCLFVFLLCSVEGGIKVVNFITLVGKVIREENGTFGYKLKEDLDLGIHFCERSLLGLKHFLF